jgi:Fic family protein
MRIPTKPPALFPLLGKALEKYKDTPSEFARITSLGPTVDGRYRHWDKLRHIPPPDGYSHEEWWVGLKMARQALLRPFGLSDGSGKAFQYALTDVMVEMLHEIDQRAGGTLRFPDQISDPESGRFYLRRSLEEEAITSSQMEGAATTRDVAKRMLRDERPPTNKSEWMIRNNFLAMQFIRQARDRPLSRELVFELHRILTESTLRPEQCGRFRSKEDEIVVADADGLTLHDPPDADCLPERLEEMCRFANNGNSRPYVHPVIRAVLLHFWLAYDHPFTDGNGRTARALFYWTMSREGYWLAEYLSISRILNQARAAYVRSFLYSETDDNDATYFILHQLETFTRAIADFHIYLERKLAERRHRRKGLAALGGRAAELNSRERSLLQHGLDHPGEQYTVAMHRNYHNVAYQTARTDLLHLAKLGLLKQMKTGRRFTFVVPADLERRIDGAD